MDEPELELPLLVSDVLLLPGELLSPEVLLLLPPGVSAAPVAEPLLDNPKYEKMLCLHPGWVRSVFGSKFGADCSLLASPENTKLNCCPLVLLEVVLLELLADDEGRKSIHGTATCLPPTEDKLLDSPEELPLGLVLPPVLLELPRLLLELLLADPGLVELEVPGLVELPDDDPLGLVLLPELLLEFSDSTAKSMRPDAGLIMVSLMVPSVSPEEPVTFAPINWLARSS